MKTEFILMAICGSILICAFIDKVVEKKYQELAYTLFSIAIALGIAYWLW